MWYLGSAGSTRYRIYLEMLCIVYVLGLGLFRTRYVYKDDQYDYIVIGKYKQ